MFRRLILIFFVGLFALPASAEVVRIEVKSRTDLLAGKAFGSAGAFETLSGKIYFAVDPGNSANRIIADIDKAPKNAAGKVEFSSDFYMIKPKNLSLGNGTVLYEVSNRGNKGMLGFFDLIEQPRSAYSRRSRRRLLAGTRLHLALGRLAVRRAQS